MSTLPVTLTVLDIKDPLGWIVSVGAIMVGCLFLNYIHPLQTVYYMLYGRSLKDEYPETDATTGQIKSNGKMIRTVDLTFKIMFSLIFPVTFFLLAVSWYPGRGDSFYTGLHQYFDEMAFVIMGGTFLSILTNNLTNIYLVGYPMINDEENKDKYSGRIWVLEVWCRLSTYIAHALFLILGLIYSYQTQRLLELNAQFSQLRILTMVSGILLTIDLIVSTMSLPKKESTDSKRKNNMKEDYYGGLSEEQTKYVWPYVLGTRNDVIGMIQIYNVSPAFVFAHVWFCFMYAYSVYKDEVMALSFGMLCGVLPALFTVIGGSSNKYLSFSSVCLFWYMVISYSEMAIFTTEFNEPAEVISRYDKLSLSWVLPGDLPVADYENTIIVVGWLGFAFSVLAFLLDVMPVMKAPKKFGVNAWCCKFKAEVVE